MRRLVFWLAFLLTPSFAQAEFDLYEGENRPYPDNCGLVYSAALVTRDLGQIVLDDGTGSLKTFYYRHDPHNKDKQCGDMAGKICFTFLGSRPVGKSLAAKGVSGETMMMIRECMELD